MFTRLSFSSSVNTFGTNFANTFLIPKFSVIISCTIVFGKFKSSDIIRPLKSAVRAQNVFHFHQLLVTFAR